MQVARQPQLVDGKLPVFVFPTSLTFCTDDTSSHKQILTLYNPYDFALKFKVLSTAPKKYTLGDTEGTIKPHCCVDIVIRHTDISLRNEGVKDKFRIQVIEHGKKSVIGKKDIISTLLPTRDKSPALEETFQQLPQSVQSSTPQVNASKYGAPNSGPSFLIVLSAIICLAALMLPSQDEKDSRLPVYLHLSLHQKLIAAYVLGLVTMALLRI
ncbi:unnamed protein product [Owenia fusiformis]|uniref:Motile sperm domain-containing protein 3 n=1 Tax=Owenia fusiformis TaxID=6347 RepID=A0A8J1Y167_OWEFU|nr:unnamed protein product [Owenia fusiformis]